MNDTEWEGRAGGKDGAFVTGQNKSSRQNGDNKLRLLVGRLVCVGRDSTPVKLNRVVCMTWPDDDGRVRESGALGCEGTLYW